MILLAEDNDDVREGLKEVLETGGYRVIEAADGADAVRKFMEEESRTSIRLLILDVMMPKKNGKEVYDLIRKVRPDVHVLFTSGYQSDVIERQGVEADRKHFIVKPFSPQILLRKVHQILDGQPGIFA